MSYSPTSMRPYIVFRALTAASLGLMGALTAVPAARAQTPAPAPSTALTSSPETAPAATPSAVTGASGELNVRISDEQGTLYIDDQPVGQGSYRATVPAGRHQLRVTRPGYDTYEAWVDVEPGQVRSELVSLRQSVAEVVPRGTAPDARGLDGPYGGIALFAAFEPSGAGTTFDDACDTTGASSCSPKSPLGAGLTGYFGWLFDPLGLELGLLASAHVDEPSAYFDGVHGSEINPLVAAPERTEKFTVGRFGGGAAIRGRLWYALPNIRFTVAAGPGLAYRNIVFRRETTAAGGFSSNIAGSDISYFSPMLSLEGGVQLVVGKSLGLTLGLISWFETASDNARSKARTDTVLFKDEDTTPQQQATPAYDLASGTQWFLGPYLGLSFGP